MLEHHNCSNKDCWNSPFLFSGFYAPLLEGGGEPKLKLVIQLYN